MAQTELLSQDDVDEIGAVLQLSPHARTSEFEVVHASSENEPLVSLDELYEKTGQESVNKVVAGFRMAVDRQRLSREHGKALNIVGAESWLAIPDKLNFIRGGEGFFESLKNGLVSFVKAIIRFISGICNWIVERIRRLFGFEKTVEEVKYLNEHTDKINKAMAGMVDELGGGREYDPVEFYKTLPNGRTDVEQLTLIKNRLDSGKAAVERISASVPAFNEVLVIVSKMATASERASDKYRKGMEVLRRKFKAKEVTIADIVRFNQLIQEEIFITLDYTELAGVLSILNEGFYGIKIDDLGVEGAMAKAREKLKSQVEVVQEKLTPDLLEAVKDARNKIAAAMSAPTSKGVSRDNMKFTEKSFSKFSDIIKLSDAEFIQEMGNNLPFQEAKDLPAVYATFTARVREYTELVDLSFKTVQEVSKTYQNIVSWYSKISALVAAYLTRDIKRIMDAHEKYLTKEERANVETKGKPDYLFDLEKDFDNNHPGLNLPEEFSRLMVTIQEVDKLLYNDRIKRFVNTLKG